LIRRRCEHLRYRCVHGDEIRNLGYRRKVCLDCGKALKGDLPIYCSITGDPHPSSLAPK
jgi:hypothetical protein